MEFRQNIREQIVPATDENEQERTEYICDVLSVERAWSPTLQAEVEANYDAWIEKAIEENEPTMTLEDVMLAVNELAEIVLGGE